mmetsp:Transcript_24912/g.80236  ORF Transcript_24912/g.80236 Transcript_24912/m.80236 type:complete len:87 (+) Transcript_24912:1107-1367(+)
MLQRLSALRCTLDVSADAAAASQSALCPHPTALHPLPLVSTACVCRVAVQTATVVAPVLQRLRWAGLVRPLPCHSLPAAYQLAVVS